MKINVVRSNLKKIIALNKSVGLIQRAYRLNKHRNGWVFHLNRYLKNSPNHKLTQFKFLDGINFCNVNEDHIHYQINVNDDKKKQIFLGTDPINLQTKVDFFKGIKVGIKTTKFAV